MNTDEPTQPSAQALTTDAPDHAWRYFQLHAQQRMSMFNYFILVLGLLIAGLVQALREPGFFGLFGIALGMCLFFAAMIFLQLDRRTKRLIDHAEAAMRALEPELFDARGQLFVGEKSATEGRGVWTYTKSFAIVFIVAAAIGVFGATWALVLHGGHGCRGYESQYRN